MPKLYNSRMSKLINPLEKGEGAFVFNSQYINYLIDDINNKKYGSYLIGGVVGSGKSSMVDLASGFVRDETILLHIKFYNEEECVNKFPQILMENIITVLKKEECIEKSEELRLKISEFEKEMLYNIEEKKVLEKCNSQGSKFDTKGKLEGKFKLFVAFYNYLCASGQMDTEASAEVGESINEVDSFLEMQTMTKKQNDKLNDILEIINLLLPRNIVIVYDELDKMNKDILQELFARYKALFVEKQIFNFFIVNENIYIKYSDTDLFKNPYFTYFSGIYYIPMLNFNETLRYITMMFGENQYINGLLTYYSSLGNYRLINAGFLTKQKKNSLEVVKAFIFKRVVDKNMYPYMLDCDKDLLIITIKNIIETIIKRKKIRIISLVDELEETRNKISEYIDYYHIIKCIISEIENLVPDAIHVEGSNIIVDVDELWRNSNEVKDVATQERIECITKEKQEFIQYSDMYPHIKKEYLQYKFSEIVFLSHDIIPLQVADNQPRAYMDVLSNVLLANLDNDNIQVILLKRARGDESYYSNDHVYTGIVIVDKGRYTVAYYVNEGCYDSESSTTTTLDKFIATTKELGISFVTMKIESRIDLSENFNYIIKKYNNI